MHYYQFNIGDYARRTKYLDLMEDLAYRRLLDMYYLNETPFTETPEELARAIGMRSHCDEVAYVLQTFFPDGRNKHADAEIDKVNVKSAKAKASAEARWNKGSMRSHSEGNATHNPIPNTHNPKSKGKKATRFSPPSLNEVIEYGKSRKSPPELARKFHEYFEAGNWHDAKGNKVKNWKQKFITWESFSKNDKPLPEPVSANSHNTFEENQKQQEEQELAMARRDGFETVKEWNDHQYKQHMKRLGVNVDE